ncbi:SPOR domain-containing protein [Roseicyclus marinus]|uniref:SPOR domain-containing protein n=1 Tax=Roseicyclus marinus TaxID=2161673 RepID=UPI00240EBE32|nr:SPOR domain-containing protein [Roseicyclus marinus]MDG3042928.1 SPOR domain-containing protein [Roseicyclus marinus]
MADYDYSGTDAVHAHPRGGTPPEGALRIGTLVNWAGAFVSLGLVIGMGIWAYQLTMRDLSGVPVIRALEGPMRVAPADPGGTQAEHQGLAVNRIAEGGDAAPVPDRLILAPPPVDLDVVALASASAPAPASVMSGTAGSAPLPTPEAASAGTQALIERLMGQAAPDAATAPADAGVAIAAETTAAPAAAVQVIPASVPGPARSLRPPTRPEAIRARAAAAPATASTATGTVDELDPAALTEGTRLVQLGAFDTPEIARGEWDRLAARFPDYFAGRARVIEEASSGGSAFFRLRAHGFDDLAASRRFCAVLMAQNAPCIPVTVR